MCGEKQWRRGLFMLPHGRKFFHVPRGVHQIRWLAEVQREGRARSASSLGEATLLKELAMPREVHPTLAHEKCRKHGDIEAFSDCAPAAIFAMYAARYTKSGGSQRHFA